MLGFYESAEYGQQRETLGYDVKRLDEQIEGLTFSIARAPDRFSEIEPHSNVRIAMTAMQDGTPDVWLLFTVDYSDGNFTLLWLDRA